MLNESSLFPPQWPLAYIVLHGQSNQIVAMKERERRVSEKESKIELEREKKEKKRKEREKCTQRNKRSEFQ